MSTSNIKGCAGVCSSITARSAFAYSSSPEVKSLREEVNRLNDMVASLIAQHNADYSSLVAKHNADYSSLVAQHSRLLPIGSCGGSILRYDAASSAYINHGIDSLHIGCGTVVSGVSGVIQIGFGNISASGTNAISIGMNAGIDSQGASSTAIGHSAGQTGQGIESVSVGSKAGYNGQGDGSVAVGQSAGKNTQGINCVAIGPSAGYGSQGEGSIAIGLLCGQAGQGAGSVAMGINAAQSSQGTNCVAIGNMAGNSFQGNNAIAIGNMAGGSFQAENSIAINATGLEITPSAFGSCKIAPIRNSGVGLQSGYRMLSYNPTTSELAYYT